MNKALKLKNIFLVIVTLELILMVLIVYFLAVNIGLKKQLSIASDHRFTLYLAADRLRQSSDDLTRFARTYVVTGCKEYKENYRTILDIRNGKAPRPSHYESIYWDYLEPLRSLKHPEGEYIPLGAIMDALPYTDKERRKLRESQQNSDDLVKIEVEAFNAMEGYFKDKHGKYTTRAKPDQMFAINLLHSPAYHLAKQKIMQPIDEFILMLNNRTLARINKLEKSSKTNSVIFVIIIGIFIITNIFVFLKLHQRVIKTIIYFTDKIKQGKGGSMYLPPIKNASKDELGMLISEFNAMQTVISDRARMFEHTIIELRNQYDIIDRNIIISETDLKGNITYASKAFCRVSGYSEEELLGSNHRIIRHSEMSSEVHLDLWKKLKSGEKWQGQIMNRKKDGSFYWVDIIIEPMKDSYGNKTGYRSICIDITDKKRVEELSITDRLTGLYNRLKLDEVFHYEIIQSERYNKSFSIIIIDIDKFKLVNDTYGHQVGDKVLKDTAEILAKNVRVSDTAGRWGGEEFLILCPETDIAGAEYLAEKLRQLMETHDFPDVNKKTASFGVTGFTAGDHEETMIGRADKALYQAKKGGRNKVIVYTD